MNIRNSTDERIVLNPGDTLHAVCLTQRGNYGDGVREVVVENVYGKTEQPQSAEDAECPECGGPPLEPLEVQHDGPGTDVQCPNGHVFTVEDGYGP